MNSKPTESQYEIRAALDELVARLNAIAPEAHGADLSVWYSSNDGTWKYKAFSFAG